ncbi:uncharacterized protein MELLADRAFT_101408 [Melampsora larici-populina 98AG31]|uniref:Uncharacterized protein n=1 Tax=Melampsora larici-populina (strain 98AG31 / pathotype 3-4-7) TaxID=747676 RepID=F4R4N1_MELLP|nr:uncharacterized protein MELLADRAFT_101408 [Melampsora larici-populina 98AG31]EGG12837.1 hypothetical protein MELLADRAFT_101408 [Melampsora larici-populina 98AG31]
MNRPCDCRKCWTKHGSGGPTVSSLTIRRHHERNGPRPVTSQPESQPVSPQPPTPSSNPAPPVLPSLRSCSDTLVSSAQDDMLKIGLSNLKITSSPPVLNNLIDSTQKLDSKGIQSPGATDGSWLFLCVSLVTYLHVIAGVSLKAVNTTLRILHLAFTRFTKGMVLHEHDQYLLKTFPLEFSTAMKWLDIEADLERSVCCPKCFKRYRYPSADEPSIPQLCTHHNQQAKAWRDAKTHKARDQIFETCGVRWSCLNELEYWDPTKMVVVDTMHCISGILEYHFRRVWNLDKLGKSLEKKKDSTSALLQEAMSTNLDITDNSDINMTDDWQPIQLDLDHAMGSNITSSMSSFNQRDHGFAFNPCALNSLEEGLQNEDEDILYDEDGNELFLQLNNSSPDVEQKDLLDTGGLKKIRSTISTTSIPSWMYPPPANLGSASHRKLRSSDWIILFTIHLPVAMFALLQASKIDPDVVTNVLHLCSLTEIVMNYQTSDINIRDYFDHLVAY